MTNQNFRITRIKSVLINREQFTQVAADALACINSSCKWSLPVAERDQRLPDKAK